MNRVSILIGQRHDVSFDEMMEETPVATRDGEVPQASSIPLKMIITCCNVLEFLSRTSVKPLKVCGFERPQN
jgi:hypothetical protein